MPMIASKAYIELYAALQIVIDRNIPFTTTSYRTFVAASAHPANIMSWASYITDHLMVALPNGHTLTHAAIIGHDGGVWASNAEFPEMDEAQVKTIVAGFDDGQVLIDKGLVLGETKYQLVKGEPGEVIRGRKGDDGVCIKKTGTAFVVGIYGKGVQAGDCNMIVEGLGDYLKEMEL